MASPFRWLWSALSVMLPCALLAAPPPQSSAPPPPRTFDEVIDVRVVNVEAVVEDRSGKRVRGLGPADFRLLVDGREVPVEYFTEVAEGKAAAGREGAAPAAGAGEDVGRGYLIFIDESFSIAASRDAALAGIAADLGRLGAEARMPCSPSTAASSTCCAPGRPTTRARHGLEAARKRPTAAVSGCAEPRHAGGGRRPGAGSRRDRGVRSHHRPQGMAERSSVETVAQARTRRRP